jgi:two-component system, LytTR family, response regulator
MINCIIIDDEQPAIDILKAYVDKVPYLNLVTTTTSSVLGLEMVNEYKIDLIFLDIQMPNITGIEFIKAINGKCKVIFTTAYNQYALDGFELDVIDYLLKPIPLDRFLKAVQKAKSSFEQINGNNNIYTDSDFLVVQGDSKGKLIKLEIKDIDYIEGMGNYVAFYCGGKKILSLINMKDLEENLLPKNFIRVHKSFIIPFSNISSVDANTILLKRNTGVEIIIGRAYKDTFLEKMKRNMIQ